MRKGFTLLELVVAIAIMLIIGAAVSPILLQHLKDAKVASVMENVLNIKSAFESWYTKEAGAVSCGTDTVNDCTPEILAKGWLNKDPGDSIFDYRVQDVTEGISRKKHAYSIILEADDSEQLRTALEIVRALDEKIDDEEDPGEGAFRWRSVSGKVMGCYILYKEPGYVEGGEAGVDPCFPESNTPPI